MVSRVAKGARPRLLLLAAAVSLAGCSGIPGSESAAEVQGGFESPVVVQLNGVVVGSVGTGILLQNHSPEDLKNVEIIVNGNNPGGGYTFRTSQVPSNSTQNFMAQVFKNSAGESLNPMQTKASYFSVYADTPRGRGSWSGGYAEQQ